MRASSFVSADLGGCEGECYYSDVDVDVWGDGRNPWRLFPRNTHTSAKCIRSAQQGQGVYYCYRHIIDDTEVEQTQGAAQNTAMSLNMISRLANGADGSESSLSSFPTNGVIRISNGSDGTKSEYSFGNDSAIAAGGNRYSIDTSDIVSFSNEGYKKPVLTTMVPGGDGGDGDVDDTNGWVIPALPHDRALVVLSRVVDAYKSPHHGSFLSGNVFLNKRALESGSITNASVKLGTLREVTSLFSKLSKGEAIDVSSIDSVLLYYEKLLDAFDHLADDIAQDEVVRVHSSSSNIQRVESVTSTTASVMTANTMNSSLSRKHGDKRKGSIFNVFPSRRTKGNPRPSSTNLSSSPNVSTSKLHSKKTSISSTTSWKPHHDYCSMDQYIALIEPLIQQLYKFKGTDSTSDSFERLVQFTDEYLLQFIIRDVSQLSLKFMKEEYQAYY